MTEVKQISLEAEARGCIEDINSFMENDHIPRVKEGIWLRFIIEKERYRKGISVISGDILFIRDKGISLMELHLINLKDGTWKLGDVD